MFRAYFLYPQIYLPLRKWIAGRVYFYRMIILLQLNITLGIFFCLNGALWCGDIINQKDFCVVRWTNGKSLSVIWLCSRPSSFSAPQEPSLVCLLLCKTVAFIFCWSWCPEVALAGQRCCVVERGDRRLWAGLLPAPLAFSKVVDLVADWCLFVLLLLQAVCVFDCCVLRLSDRKEPSWSSCLAGTASAPSMICSWPSRCFDQVLTKATLAQLVGIGQYYLLWPFTYTM